MIYFDNAATTKPNAKALEQAAKFLTNEYFNPSAPYENGAKLLQEIKMAKTTLLKHIGGENTFELTFTASGTEADNTAIFAFARRGNAVTSASEHSAVLAPFAELKNRAVIEPRYAGVNPDGSVNEEELLSLIDDKTCFVSIMHVNNETGAINDINALAKKVKAKNPRVIFHSDGVQAYGKLPYRLSQDIDLYSISAHKLGGLKGVGALIKKKGLVLRPYIYGGGQESGLRSGTENVFGIKSFEYAATEKFLTLKDDFARMLSYKEKLISLLDKDVYSVLSGEKSSPYILYLSAVGLKGEVLVRVASDKGLLIGTGSACSTNSKLRYSKVALACGFGEKTAESVLRLSFSVETKEEEIDKAAEILNEIGKEYAKKMR